MCIMKRWLISFRPEEQLQLVEREEIDDEEDLFEAIDKRNIIFFSVAKFLWLSFFSFGQWKPVALFNFKYSLFSDARFYLLVDENYVSEICS